MKPALLLPLLLVMLFLSVGIQDMLPEIPPSKERIQLLPVVFCFGVLALPLLPALFFALTTAVVQGLLLLQVQAGQAEFGLTWTVVFFLCWAILLQMTSETTHGMRWELHALGSALVTFTLLGGEFVMLCIVRGGFPLDPAALLRIAVPSAAALLIAPLLYLMLRSLVPLSQEGSQTAKQPDFDR
jgi:hypothetical protein